MVNGADERLMSGAWSAGMSGCETVGGTIRKRRQSLLETGLGAF
jgi:hypothetical protein